MTGISKAEILGSESTCTQVSWLTAAAILASGIAPLLTAQELDSQEVVMFAFDDHSIPWHDNLHLTMAPIAEATEPTPPDFWRANEPIGCELAPNCANSSPLS